MAQRSRQYGALNKMAAKGPHSGKSSPVCRGAPLPTLRTFLNGGDFFFLLTVWLLITEGCNWFSPYRRVPRILTPILFLDFFLSPLGAAQAGAIDVISFPEARGEDPAAIYCLSAVLKRQRVPSVRRRVMNHGGPVETLRLAPAGWRDDK